ncbi:DUF899 domain-containing protein [Actinokineospora xionganensis]|uniref:DUF899 domain-containing protein n=1 Tax=Actinokineospora xionganensis TaxID=2684470 RepID=A0ABR7L3Z9_9PSEU|nr:DUF899 domain-containing protein [Actinokineospora xionganensis]MBC6447405.1 DUF899 domain-containing protein [Actinokineospora xionganensis]
MSAPKVVTRDEWLVARGELLAREKEISRAKAEVDARRRELPMVRMDKEYKLAGPNGPVGLLDLFEGRRQLIVYHFMFDPAWDEGCASCSLVADNIGHLAHLHVNDTSLALVSRAPLAKIEPFKARMGWTMPWFSSHDSDFNYDFQVSHDESITPPEYNYKDADTLRTEGLTHFLTGEDPGASVFLREGDDIFHTYSTYARGLDTLLGTYHYLDLTPLGRQRYVNQFRHHDRYDEVTGHSCH